CQWFPVVVQFGKNGTEQDDIGTDNTAMAPVQFDSSIGGRECLWRE
ncbi:hypothetical protein Tco_0309426, partial [Tanacetum coccineum]